MKCGSNGCIVNYFGIYRRDVNCFVWISFGVWFGSVSGSIWLERISCCLKNWS